MGHPFVKWLTKIKLVDYDMGYTKLPALNHPFQEECPLWTNHFGNPHLWRRRHQKKQIIGINNDQQIIPGIYIARKEDADPFKRRWARLGVSVPDVEDCTGEIPSEIPDVVLETGDLITTEKEILAAGRSPSTQAGRPRGISTQQPWNGGHGIVALVGRIGRRRSANKKVLLGEKNQDTDTSPSSNLPSAEGGARSQRRAGIEVFAGPLWSHASWLSTNDHGDRRDQRKSHRQNESWPIHTLTWSAIHLSVDN